MPLWIETFSAFLGIALSVGTLLTATLPSLRTKLGNWLGRISGTGSLRGEISEIRLLLKEHVGQDETKKKELELQKEVDRCVLRDLITNIYYKYLDEKKIPIYELEDAAALHELYRKRGGNSYVQHIYRQMTEDWEVIA